MAARTPLTTRQIRNPNVATVAAVKAKLTEHDAALDAVCDNVGNEHVSAAGAIDPTCYLTTLAIDATKAYTLAVGTKIGQKKVIRCTAATNTPAGSVAGLFVNGATAATSLAFNAAEDTVILVWNGTKWAIALNISVVVS